MRISYQASVLVAFLFCPGWYNTHMETFVLSLLLIGSLLILVMMFTEMVAFVRSRVPFVPTTRADVLDLAKRLPITDQDYVFDLGSGNGKVVFLIEQATGARVKGIQYGGWTQWYAKLKKIFTRSKAELVNGNFFNHPWHEATIIYGYLYPPLMPHIGVKAQEECRPGTKIVVRDFYIPYLELKEEWQTPTGHNMYLYVI